MLRFVALTALLAGCGWNHLPNGGTRWLERPLWDPAGVVATTDGLFVPLPTTGQMAFVSTSGDSNEVAVRPGVVAELLVSPDPSRAMALVQYLDCPVEGPADCLYDDQEVRTEIAVLQDGDVEQTLEVAGAFNSLSFSHDGTWAVAWLDLRKDLQVSGVVSLSSVIVLDMVTGEATPVGVGFAAERVLFTDDDTRAVVLSQSEVAVVDLTAAPPQREVTFPLVLDPDEVVVPVGVSLTPDGRFALISVEGRPDLYVLDLDNPAVNLVSLAGNPSAMVVDGATDQTVITFSSRSRVDVLEHTFFEIESIGLDEPMNQILHDDGLAVLWNQGNGHDVYRLDLETLDLVEYRLQNPAVQVLLAPTDEFALALTRPEGGGGQGAEGLYDLSPGLEILDLREGEDDTFPYLLEGQGVGAAFVSTETSLDALVLQEGVDYLYALDLYTNQAERIGLSDPPVGIGTVPDGPFYITHDDGLGAISFFDPATRRITEASGFATFGILDERPFDPEAY